MYDFDEEEIERDEEDFEDSEFETSEDEEEETLEELDIDDNGHVCLGRKRRKRSDEELDREFDDE